MQRTAYFVNFFFFKNMLFAIQQFFYSFYSGFSAQTFVEDGYLLNFNSIVTAVAPVYYATYEQDVNPAESKQIHDSLPRLYEQFRRKQLFTTRTFLSWMVQGVLYAGVVFFGVLYFDQRCILDGNDADQGRTEGLWTISVTSYFSTVIIVWAVQLIDTSMFTVATYFAYGVMSLMLFIVFVFVWDQISSPIQYQLLEHLGNIKFWLIVVFNTGVCVASRILFRNWRKLFNKNLVDVLQYLRLEKQTGKHEENQELLRLDDNDNEDAGKILHLNQIQMQTSIKSPTEAVNNNEIQEFQAKEQIN